MNKLRSRLKLAMNMLHEWLNATKDSANEFLPMLAVGLMWYFGGEPLSAWFWKLGLHTRAGCIGASTAIIFAVAYASTFAYAPKQRRIWLAAALAVVTGISILIYEILGLING